MNNRIDNLFKNLKAQNKKALITYISAGDPNIGLTKRLILELAKSGANLIELGVAFSDPLADGPTIQAAGQRALKKGINLDKIFALVKDARRQVDLPIALMSYYNPIFKYGIKKFVNGAKRSGVDGVIIPDLPPEEAAQLVSIARKSGLSTIFMAAPTTGPDRLKIIAKYSTGFIYYVSLTGVTGARSALERDIKRKIGVIRGATRKPVCIGFGISSARQAGALSSYADGVIVGSAIIDIIEKNLARPDMVKKVGRFVRSLCASLG